MNFKVELESDDLDNEVMQRLSSPQISHDVHNQVECKTSEKKQNNVPISAPIETHTKNLLIVALSSTVNTKEFGTELKLQGEVNLRFADEKTF